MKSSVFQSYRTSPLTKASSLSLCVIADDVSAHKIGADWARNCRASCQSSIARSASRAGGRERKVVGVAVTRDVVWRIGLRDIPCSFADHDQELCFVVELISNLFLRQRDGAVRGGKRIAIFVEEDRTRAACLLVKPSLASRQSCRVPAHSPVRNHLDFWR